MPVGWRRLFALFAFTREKLCACISGSWKGRWLLAWDVAESADLTTCILNITKRNTPRRTRNIKYAIIRLLPGVCSPFHRSFTKLFAPNSQESRCFNQSSNERYTQHKASLAQWCQSREGVRTARRRLPAWVDSFLFAGFGGRMRACL
ncbi:hypothetical protein BU16DRAFT_340538 [Lophium mytilinum]|uniref:Secreted protein n=1 Tax=Lophium mytilinum TaxID=390894 RepID=A0A6A6QWC9_9PEZI|nr:hypothetical protein BU16DRAFT_340538 [Lophium mytilinum]